MWSLDLTHGAPGGDRGDHMAPLLLPMGPVLPVLPPSRPILPPLQYIQLLLQNASYLHSHAHTDQHRGPDCGGHDPCCGPGHSRHH